MSDVTAPLMVGTIAVVGVGTIVTDKTVNMKAVMAGGIVALGLSAIDNADERIAELLAGLIFLTACFKFLPGIVESLGFTGGESGKDVDPSKATARPSVLAQSGGKTGAGGATTIAQTTPYSVATPQLGGGATTPPPVRTYTI